MNIELIEQAKPRQTPAANAPARGMPNGWWIPPFRVPLRAVRSAWRLSVLCESLTRGWRWFPAAVVAGTIPMLLSRFLRVPGQQMLSAIFVAFLLLGYYRTDAWRRAVTTLAVAFFAHSALVIGLTAANPDRCVAYLPGGENYWQRQLTWINTGRDPEYAPLEWVPAHAQLIGAMTLFSYTSLGTIAWFQGFYEVDLMNYYNAQMIRLARHPAWALLFGWHIWSIFRGIGYLFLTWETAAWSFRRLTRMALSSRGRALRIGIAASFLLADAVAKYYLMEPFRRQLAAALYSTN